MEGFFYLHTNGTLHWKVAFATSREDLEESPFVRRFWHVPKTPLPRLLGWRILLEAIVNNMDPEEALEFAAHGGMTIEDLPNYLRAEYYNEQKGEEGITAERKVGVHAFLAIHGIDPQTWLGWLAQFPVTEDPDFSTMPQPGGREDAVRILDELIAKVEERK